MLDRRTILLSCAALPFLTTAARAASPYIFAPNGLAIGGYDPLAYTSQGAAVLGDPAHAVMWKGATWHFLSAENRAAFEQNPEAHAPAYGGYCAFALAKGALASSDPAAFTVHDGRLFLNQSIRVRRRWLDDRDAHIVSADARWPQILD